MPGFDLYILLKNPYSVDLGQHMAFHVSHSITVHRCVNGNQRQRYVFFFSMSTDIFNLDNHTSMSVMS